MSSDKMREEFEAWHCEQYKTKHTTGAPTRDMHNGVWDQDYCSKKSQALWVLWQATGGDVTKVEALKEEIERIEEGKQPVAWFRPDALGCAVWKPFATQTLKDGAPLFTRPDSGDVIREMNDELVDLRARLAEAQEVLRDCIEVGELDAETQWKAERVSKGRRVYVDDRALSDSAEPSAPKCCEPTPDELASLAAGDYTPEELWGGSKPTCPKCHKAEPSAPVGRDWEPLTSSGQVQLGDWMSFRVAGSHICAKATLIIDPGTEHEEIVYNVKKNHYFITSMAIDGTSTHKGVLVAKSMQELAQ